MMMLAVLPTYLIHLSKRSRYGTDNRSGQETAQYASNASDAAFQKANRTSKTPPSNVDLDPQSPLQKAGLSRKGPPTLTQRNPTQPKAPEFPLLCLIPRIPLDDVVGPAKLMRELNRASYGHLT